MLKTISAALLAASVLAAPVLAAQSTKTTANAPVINTTQPQTKTAVNATGSKVIHRKTVQSTAKARPAVLNANAEMGKHHRKHLSYHHRHHAKMSAFKTRPSVHAKTMLKSTPKVSLKPAASTTKRG